MFSELETPHALVDLNVVHENIALVHDYAKEHDLRVRPHTKTHKDPDIGKLQLAAGAAGLTVATTKEAEVMAKVTRDLLVAYPPVDDHRIARLLALPKNVELTVALDSEYAIARLRAAAKSAKRFIRILAEIDLGSRRTGVNSVADLLALAHEADSDFTAFSGVLFHPGHLRTKSIEPGLLRETSHPRISAQDDEETLLSVKTLAPRSHTSVPPMSDALAASQLQLRDELRLFLQGLREKGFECPVVSGGNTPTLFLSHLIPELTEIRPGTYVYSDRDIASQGLLPWSSCAYSVLATVISTSVPGQAVIDAGTKALAREPLPGLEGYGALLDRPDVLVTRLSEEHGILDLTRSNYQPKVGERVRVVPNHVCVSVHLQDKIAFLENGAVHLREVAARGR